jgi:hypothetical protein
VNTRTSVLREFTMTSRREVPQLITSGVIAAEVRAPLHRVLHILTTRRHIRPTARAGNLRLYDRATIAMVRHELSAIDARQNHVKTITDTENGHA